MEISQNRDPIHGGAERPGSTALVMSGPRSARSDGWNICRAGHSARVAGADLAPAGPYAGHVGAWLVLEPVPRGPVALDLEPPGRLGFDWLNRLGRCNLGTPACRLVGSQAVLGHLL